MSNRTDIAYHYDGTLEGLLCCVFESYERREEPSMLLSPTREQLCLFETRDITTDLQKADRVSTGIAARICLDALELVDQAFLCCAPEVDLHILRFIRMGFRVGAPVMDMLTAPPVAALMKAILHMTHEVQLLTGFVRFRDVGDALVAVIEPKNRVLPMLRAHFCERFNAETFMIYDQTHSEALVHQRGKSGIFRMELLDLPEICDKERYVHMLWQGFYKAIGIKERANDRCRMNHMPKRYWPHMLEMDEVLGRPAQILSASAAKLCYNQLREFRPRTPA